MKETGPRNLATRQRRLTRALYALLAVTVAATVVYAGHVYNLHRLTLGERPNATSLVLLDATDTVQSLAFIIAIVLFIAWIWRACANLRDLPGVKGPAPTPMEAATCWFIPVLNVYTAHRAMKRLYHASMRTPTGSWPAPQAINVFWAGWVISATIHLLNFFPAAGDSATARQLLEPAYATVAANAVAAVSLVRLLAVTAEITEAQQQETPPEETVGE